MYFKDFRFIQRNMNRLIYMAGVVMAAIAISSCDEDTLTIGNSLTNESDELTVTTKTAYIITNTILADSVLSSASTCYLGKVEDPETHAEVKSEFSTQFNILNSMSILNEKYIISKEDNQVVADSCDVAIFLENPFNSSDLHNAMTLRVRELASPVDQTKLHYSNYDINHLLRTDNGAIDYNHPFTYENLTDEASERSKTTYFNNIRIPLNQPYTDKDNQTYKNYGTYILRKLIEYRNAHEQDFPNSFVFARDICPGFFFEITNGIGFHAAAPHIGLRIYYRTYKDTLANAALSLAGTKEVMQTIKVTNNKTTLQALANDNSLTYLKTPSGLFTEALLPVENIWKDHEGDSLLAAKVSFQRINNQQVNERTLSAPQTILMVMKDSLYSFFEKKELPDSKTSYITSINKTYNVYTFTNISRLVTQMWRMRNQYMAQDPTWADPKSDHYKVVLVPITYTTSSSSTTPTSISHDLSLRSTKLVGGKDSPIELNAVFAKFKR